MLLVSPPPLGELSEFAEVFEGGPAKSRQLSRHFGLVAEKHGCELLDASTILVTSDADGFHFDPSEQPKLGEAVAARVKQVLS